MKSFKFFGIVLGFLLAGAQTAAAGAPAGEQTDWGCIKGLAENGADSLTLGEMRHRCAEPEAQESKDTAASRRMAQEREAAARPFSILAHKPNYALFAAWNSEGWNSIPEFRNPGNPGYQNDDIEAQFQISLKLPLAVDLFNGRMELWAAYTNRSFWQMYNRDNSEPFRETNHEPELWLQFRNDWEILGLTNVVNTVGWVHQSNGRTEPSSRSWNRVYANFIFERENVAVSIKPWLWISRDRASSDNPDITDYMGHGELRAAWTRNGHVLSGMIRNQIESGFEHGAVELGWSFPVSSYPYLKGYVQYFHGYGESLIDYDHKVNRIGIGLSVTDWLD